MTRVASNLFRRGSPRRVPGYAAADYIPDTELLEKCLEGDRHAWAELVNRYARLVYAVPRGCGLDEQEASLVFETVFAWLLANLEQLSRYKHLHPALLARAQQVTLERMLALGQCKSDGTPPDLHDVLNATRRVQAAELLRLAVSALPLTDRELIWASLHEPAFSEQRMTKLDPVARADPERRSAALAHLVEMLAQLGLTELLPTNLGMERVSAA